MIPIYSQHRIRTPNTLPLELPEVKNYLKIEHKEDDELLETLIDAVTTRFEHHTSCALILQDWQVSFRKLESLSIPIPMRPAVCILEIETVDYNSRRGSLEVTNLLLEPEARTATFKHLPFGYLVKIRYTAGYGANPQDIPAEIRSLLLSHVAMLYENRASSITLQIPDTEYESFKISRL
jgi:uncharacterized phiE125 gp8 family phage protein